MFGGEAARSAAEHGLLKAADTGTTDAGIRSDVGDPATATVNKGTTTRDIIAAPEGDGQYARTVTPQQYIYLRTRSAFDPSRQFAGSIEGAPFWDTLNAGPSMGRPKTGRASCRERVCQYV